ncbi:MAG TPA: O-antigen ligase family protein [Pyrinomonadaceae bacterium]|nr:O-antigen ligase family protein [Pyrinomonadaceae bacterium]
MSRSKAHRLDRIIFYGLLAFIALSAVPYGTVELWWQALFELAVFTLAALWLVEGFLSGSYQWSTYRILPPLVALAVFGLVQTIPLGVDKDLSQRVGVKVWRALSADPHGTRLWVARMLSLILVAALLLRYTSSQRRLRSLIYVVIGIAVVSALFGLMRKMMQHEPGFLLPHLMPGWGYGQFINNNHFAFLMEIAIGLLLGLMVAGGVRRDRLTIYIGLALLLGMSLVISNSRGGILSMLAQVIFVAAMFPAVRSVRGASSKWLWLVGSSRVIRAVLLVCLVATISVGIVWVGGDSLLGRLEVIPGEVSSREGGSRWGDRRIDIWRASWQLVKTHPVAGVGMGGYWMAITAYHDASGEMTPQRAHNEYLELLASGGLIGVALAVWFVVGLIGPVGQRLRSRDRFRRAATFGALVGLCGIAIHSMVDFGLHTTVNAVLAMALLAIATADVPIDKEMSSSQTPSG